MIIFKDKISNNFNQIDHLIMKKHNNKKYIILASILIITGFVALLFHNYKTKTSFKYEEKKAEELKPETNAQDPVNKAVIDDAKSDKKVLINNELLKILPDDYVLGDKNAPVLMIEYASLSCPHCASFVRESFEKLKTEYIETGKVAFIFRSFPLNHPALASAMVAECHAKNSSNPEEKYYSITKIMFRTQDSWAFDQNFLEKLEAILKLDSMSSEKFKECINSKNLQEKILANRMEAAKSLQIKSTPTFYINQEVAEGYIDYLTLKKIIDSKLNSSETK
jgi:protein-disulfide isomerase